jgi:hypothetical protein
MQYEILFKVQTFFTRPQFAVIFFEKQFAVEFYCIIAGEVEAMKMSNFQSTPSDKSIE